MRACLSPLLLLALAACGSAPSAFFGAVDGKTFKVASSAFAVLDGSVGGDGGAAGSGPIGLVVLSDSKSVCDDARAGSLTHGRTYFALTLAKIDLASQAVVAPATGTYAGAGSSTDAGAVAAVAAAGGLASGYLLVGDDTCANALAADAAAVGQGTVTVTALSAQSGGSARGSFTLKIGSQNSDVSGRFDAPFCTELGQLSAGLLQSTTPPCR